MSISSKTAVLVYAKYPTPGAVKTRIAKIIGNEKAAELYRKMLFVVVDGLLEALASDRFDVIVCFDPAQSAAAYEKLFPGRRLSFLAQRGNDLGERLENSFEGMLEAYERVLVVGTDCVELSRAILEEAASGLKSADAVVGPATDGGYYLIGLKEPRPELFRGIEWSTSRVLGQTLERCQTLNLTVHRLAELTDVDTVDELSRYDFLKSALD